MIMTARKVRALGVLAMFVGACTSQVPSGTGLKPAPFQAQTVPVANSRPATSAAQADQAEGQDATDLRRGNKPSPRKPAPQKPAPRKPAPQRPSPRPTPDQRYNPPDNRYQDPDYRYRNPDYRYYPPDNRYTEAVKITRTWVEKVGPDTVTVNWTTNVATNGQVSWRNGTEWSQSPWQTPADSYHTYTIKGLEPGTTYWYKVTAQTTAGSAVSSPEATVTTEGAPAPEAPAPADGN